jgi:hypothetical protein
LRFLKRLRSDKALQFRLKKWFWAANLPAVVVVYFFPPIWESVSILYLALVSVWALVDTAASGEQAAEAARKAAKDQGASS